MKNHNDVTSKGGSNYRALTWKYLVFWICGRLWEVVAYEEVVAHGGSTVYSNVAKRL